MLRKMFSKLFEHRCKVFRTGVILEGAYYICDECGRTTLIRARRQYEQTKKCISVGADDRL